MARRDRSKEEFWQRMIARQAESGLSVRAWCGRHDVSEASFYWWRRRLAGGSRRAPKSGRRGKRERSVGRGAAARPATRGDAARVRFVPVRVTADRAGTANFRDLFDDGSGRPGGIEIILSGHQRVRVLGAVNRQMLADVLAVLRDEVAVETTADAGPIRSIPSRRARSC